MESFEAKTGEKILKITYDHWLILLRIFFVYIVGWLIIFFLCFIVLRTNDLLEHVLFLIAICVFWAIHLWMFIYIFHRELSPLVITNKRVIDFQFLPYEKHDFIFVDLKEIRQVENRQNGLLKNIFNFGDLQVNLEGNERVVFYNVSQPGHIATLLENLYQEHHWR